MEKIRKYSIISLLFFTIVLLAIIIAERFFKLNMIICLGLFGVFAAFYLIIFSLLSNLVLKKNESQIDTSSSNISLLLMKCQIGLLRYNESYTITSISELFLERKIDCVGEKLLAVFPELDDIINGVSNEKTVIFNQFKFKTIKLQDNNVLIFKDITREYNLEQTSKEESYVLGFANFDNYDEANESEDAIAYVNANIKVPVIDYFKKYNVVYRTIRSNRLQLILNYRQLELLMKDRFSILDKIKDESSKGELNLSLSMAFTYGSNNLNDLDKEAIELLELAQTRGGDQVIVRQKDSDPIYFGGSTEAKEKKSKVKVRVMSNTIKQVIKESKNVFIVGHKDSDCDCIGAMFGMSAISKIYNDETYVVIKGKSLEKTASEVIEKYNKEINENMKLISEEDAMTICDKNSLVILCDHHSLDQANCESLISKSNKIIVIDHHRRKADLEYNAILLYLEASASSTCELISEFFEFDKRIAVPEFLANMMYLGIIIDTNHFKARVNSRTFESAGRLKELGADTNLCEELSQESFDLIKTKTEIMNYGKEYDHNIIIAAIEDGEYTRSLASQACDSLVETKGTKAAFVICKTSKDDVIVSARSNGEINVQLILEGMNGGGHMTSAGLQRKKSSIEELKKELIENIDKYFNEGEGNNESNIIE